MSDYRRWFVAGGTYFFTIVTYDRRPILTSDPGRKILRKAVLSVQEKFPFSLVATVLLPDHWHLVMTLPSEDARYSLRIKKVKESFTTDWLSAGLPEATVTPSQKARGERGIWQPRFNEHTIRDETDPEHHVDYTHWNPLKHKLVTRVVDWPWSSFHRFVRLGYYDSNWGGTPPFRADDDIWGE